MVYKMKHTSDIELYTGYFKIKHVHVATVNNVV